jgi:tellurite resistance protein TerC
MTSLWIVFAGVTMAGLWGEIVAINDQRKQSAKFGTTLWLLIAVFFGILVTAILDLDSGLQFFAGYLVELSLSVDNLFIFMSVFSYFKITGLAQQKALTYGILGAICMRMFFVITSISLLNRFEWLMYVFGALLIFSAFGMCKSEKGDGGHQAFFASIKKICRLRDSGNKLAFFTKSDGKIYATPLLACVITIELLDIVFAVDSVPAVLSITCTPVIVFSSNIFAIIGLRSLYGHLTRLVEKFHLMKYGIAATLIFIGGKIMLRNSIHISTLCSTFVIVSFLLAAMIASLIVHRKNHNCRGVASSGCGQNKQ